MCGFIGILDFNDEIDQSIFKKSLKNINHRGPDASGIWFNKKNVLLGHNRLSIIDTSENANQPMLSANKEAVIVFNGEIYNFKNLKENLSFKKFKTHSDTEVILEGYLEKGTSFFKNLRGIYSFAIFDRRITNKIILARDPSGVKPLYYYTKKNKIVFGSEIKAIKPLIKNIYSINEIAIKQYLNLGYVPEPNTVYNEINALNPGNYYIWSHEKTDANAQQERKFYSYDFDNINSNSFEQNIEKTSYLLENAVKRNLVSDVNINLSLSGGIDSSIIYYYANKHEKNILAQTISFSNDSNFDESKISKNYSRHLSGRHEIIKMKENIDLEFIDKIFLHFDQPYADTSAIPTYFINKEASKSTKVIIGGDGGDELFNGYPSQTFLSLIMPMRDLNFFWRCFSRSTSS